MNHSFKFLLLGLFTVGASIVGAQNSHPISEYDDEGIRTFNIPELLKNFEGALNIGPNPLAAITAQQNKAMAAIGKKMALNTNSLRILSTPL